MFKQIKTRKTISLTAIVVLSFVVTYSMLTGKEIPQSIDKIIVALIGFLGYYFGKSTALENLKTEGEKYDSV